VSGPLYGASARALLDHGAALCGSLPIAFANARDLDQSTQIEADPAGGSIVAWGTFEKFGIAARGETRDATMGMPIR
jgi:hypothetical protein